MNYAEVFSRLTFETANIVFLKKDGTARLMLGTRNLGTVALEYGFQGQELGGRDNRCNINNGNVAIFDLVLGEARSFNIDRLVYIDYVGVISNADELNQAAVNFSMWKEEYEKTQPSKDDIGFIHSEGGDGQ